ncbi:non-canonical purine NTP pyrophosphatase [Patescibacteria group bacterium]|nr:non-canonical purine NTP pyrophosphatase [Patescibacteria group bacterium]
MSSLTFITGNPHKAALLKEYWPGEVEHLALELPEIQSLDLKEVVTHKARAAYSQLKQPVLVEDVSLVFPALGQLPGPFIKWFLASLGPKKICDLVYLYPDRTARATVMYALCDGTETRIFSGEEVGRVSPEPRGETGFGWDVLFIPDGAEQTRAEMTPQDRERYSMRKKALADLAWYYTEKP